MHRLTALLCAAALATGALAHGQAGRASSEYLLGSGNLAIKGYDPVAYFEQGGGRAIIGKRDLSHEHGGVVYHFANEANRERFVADPSRYEPAYGGWCAYAMSRDKKVEIDPQAFRIGEGRLLLFVDSDSVEFDGDWVRSEHELLGEADANWKRRTGEQPRRARRDSWRFVNVWNLTDDSLAIEGYDPVSYFPEGGGKPKQGSKRHQQRYKGVLYRFASEANKERFVADPDNYEPQHGGWCSYAMGVNGDKVEVDPEAFRLTNGQLHLFYNSFFSDTRDDWDADTADLKRKADENWSQLVEETAPRG